MSVIHQGFDVSQKLKDMNASLSQTVQLLNHKLIANMTENQMKLGAKALSDQLHQAKRVKTNEDAEHGESGGLNRSKTHPPVFAATLIDEDPTKYQKTQLDDGPTQLDDGGPQDTAENWAFELNLFLDDEIKEQMRRNGENTHFPPELIRWDGKDEVSYIAGREKLSFLPDACKNRVSREHCKLTARRTALGNGKYEYSFKITDTSGNGTFFFTLDDRGRYQLQKLKKNTVEGLQDGKLIGIAAKPPAYDKILVGFSFKTFENQA
jgi:hypothetical protein